MRNAIRRILVPLDPSMFAEAATETACRIARAHRATVSGVAVLDSEGIRSSLVPAIGPYYPLMIDAVQEKVQHADRVLHDCLSRFSKACEEAGIEHVESEYQGIPVQKLLESSIFHDLMVIGIETSFDFETQGGKKRNLTTILDRTSTPIIAVPARGLEEPKKVLITFDGSFSSARAMHDFVGFAAPYNPEVTIVTAEEEPNVSGFLQRNAASFLNAHGIDQIKLIASEEPVDQVINQELLDQFDLVVAGIHSRKPLKDYFVGSFTKKLVEGAETALFLSH